MCSQRVGTASVCSERGCVRSEIEGVGGALAVLVTVPVPGLGRSRSDITIASLHAAYLLPYWMARFYGFITAP